MPSPNRIVVATAGSGKTTGIAAEACAYTGGRTALITYTINGVDELRESVFRCHGYVPPGMEVGTWFTFLMRHFVRPYQRGLYDVAPIRRLAFVSGRSAKFAKKANIDKFYFASPGEMYSDKISQFACELIEATGGLPLQRLEEIIDKLFIDEVQDLAGYDLDLVEHLLGSNIDVVMVGDIRQATYRTNNSNRHAGFAGAKIIGKFMEWEKAGQASIQYETHSHRCIQGVCDLADQFYPHLPDASSLNTAVTGHDGIFAVRASDARRYMDAYDPQVMRLDAKTEVPGTPINFGAAKGKSFDRILIFPHKKLLAVVESGDPSRLGDAPSTIAKVYVGITRARQSVCFVVPDNMTPKNIDLVDF